MRGVDEAGGQVDPAPLAAGEVLDQAVAEAADIEAVDELVGERAAGAPAAPAQARQVRTRFSRAVRFLSSAANCPVSEMRPARTRRRVG